jgi:hypothetical protein
MIVAKVTGLKRVLSNIAIQGLPAGRAIDRGWRMRVCRHLAVPLFIMPVVCTAAGLDPVGNAQPTVAPPPPTAFSGASREPLEMDEIRVQGRQATEDFVGPKKSAIARLGESLANGARPRGTTVKEFAGSDGTRIARVTTPWRIYWLEQKPRASDFAGMGPGGLAMNCYGGCR